MGRPSLAISQEYEDPALDPGPPISIRSLLASARRHRVLLIGMALAGLLLGAALHVVLPSKSTATSEVYLVEASGSDPTTTSVNEVALLQSGAVASAAAHAPPAVLGPAAAPLQGPDAGTVHPANQGQRPLSGRGREGEQASREGVPQRPWSQIHGSDY